MKVKGDTEAIKLMNDSEFGLTASIWTKDTDRGAELAEEVDAGTVFVNRCDYPSPVGRTSLIMPKLLTNASGPCMDGLEELWQRCYPKQVRIRSVCEAEKFSREGFCKVASHIRCRNLANLA
jgi:acyl-CoA reductase-like NAD-dependent aldehyde dehydrogenase